MKLEGKAILLTGGSGFLGQHIKKELLKRGVKKIIIPRSGQDDLRNFANCQRVLKNVDIVIHAAGNVGGIGYNQSFPGSLFYDNLLMGIQLMEAARLAQVQKFVSIGTVCSYPKFTPVPFREESIWDGYPEETNAPYGLAKKMLLVQGQAYKEQYGFNSIFLLPVNMYGPGDHFEKERSHVIPALIVKVIEAKQKKLPVVSIWGSGKATREFLYVEDAAKAIVLATEKYQGREPVNIGSGMEISISDLTKLICDLCHYQGKIVWDKSKPDGQPRRSLDTSRAKKEFGFIAKTDFRQGLQKTIAWYLKN